MLPPTPPRSILRRVILLKGPLHSTDQYSIMAFLLIQNNIKKSLTWSARLWTGIWLSLTLSFPLFCWFTAHWPYWHCGSSANTQSPPTSGHLYLLFPLLTILSPQISEWFHPSLCSYLCLDVTFAERVLLISLIPPHPCSFAILLPGTLHLWVDLFVAHCLLHQEMWRQRIHPHSCYFSTI